MVMPGVPSAAKWSYVTETSSLRMNVSMLSIVPGCQAPHPVASGDTLTRFPMKMSSLVISLILNLPQRYEKNKYDASFFVVFFADFQYFKRFFAAAAARRPIR